jgi:hypothetical protein
MGAGEGRTAAACSRGASARNCVCGKAWKRGKRGRRCSLPQRGAPGALARRWKAAEQRRIGRPRCGGGGLAQLGFARRGRRLEGAGRRLYRAADGAST